jgi:hypothetical protein
VPEAAMPRAAPPAAGDPPACRVSASAAAMSAAVPAARVSASRAILRIMPESALPAPTSTKRRTPCAAIHSTLSRQRTRAVTCRTRSRRISAGSVTGRAVTLATSGTDGAARSTSPSACSIAAAAGRISAQWKGALTGSRRARFAPRSRASATARSTAPRWPETTTWAGSLSLAASQTPPAPVSPDPVSPDPSPPAAASAAIASTAARSRPRIAAIAPSPTGTAACIASPRSRSRRAASGTVRLPAAQRAEYSPSEWPATKSGAASPSASSARKAASEVAIRAGWAFAVRVSASAGPSHMVAESFSPRAASTSSNTARAAG